MVNILNVNEFVASTRDLLIDADPVVKFGFIASRLANLNADAAESDRLADHWERMAETYPGNATIKRELIARAADYRQDAANRRTAHSVIRTL